MKCAGPIPLLPLHPCFRRSRRSALFIATAAAGFGLAGAAMAGPNAGGTLILHVPDIVVDTTTEWCPVVEQVPLDACENATVTVDGPHPHLWVV